MERKTIYVGICNLKGGCGKSVMTTILASALHYTMGKKVLVIDGDHPQFSIATLRERDVQMIEHNNYYKELFLKQFKETKKKGYKIIRANPKNIIKVATKHLEKDKDIDVIFFDMSGSTNEGILATSLTMDYIFCPIIPDPIVLQSSLAFITTLTSWLNKSSKTDYPLKDLHLFWTKIDKRESKGVYNIANSMIAKLKIKKMKSELTESNKYKKEMSASRRDFFRSTMFPPNPIFMKGIGLDLFIEEFCRIIKLN